MLNDKDETAVLLEIVKKTESPHRLWNNEDFQIKLGQEQTEIDSLAAAGLVIRSKPTSVQQVALDLIGADPPQTPEDQLRLYLQFRAVVNFWTRKRDQLKAASEKHENAKKRLHELGRQSGNIPARRIAVR